MYQGCNSSRPDGGSIYCLKCSSLLFDAKGRGTLSSMDKTTSITAAEAPPPLVDKTNKSVKAGHQAVMTRSQSPTGQPYQHVFNNKGGSLQI